MSAAWAGARRVALLSAPPSEREIIRRLTEALLRFASPNGAHLALRSAYSPRGVCETTAHTGRCSPLCQQWHADIEMGATYLESTAPSEAGGRARREARVS